MLFVTQHWVAFLMLNSDTRAMGCFVDVVWYDLNVTPEWGRGHSHFRAVYDQIVGHKLGSLGRSMAKFLFGHRLSYAKN